MSTRACICTVERDHHDRLPPQAESNEETTRPFGAVRGQKTTWHQKLDMVREAQNLRHPVVGITTLRGPPKPHSPAHAVRVRGATRLDSEAPGISHILSHGLCVNTHC